MNVSFRPKFIKPIMHTEFSDTPIAKFRVVNDTVKLSPDAIYDLRIQAYKNYLKLDDIIPPDELKDLSKDDYVLLISRTDSIDKIKKEGLKSLEVLAKEPNADEKLIDCFELRSYLLETTFTNDPSLIYFRPVTEHSGYSVTPNDILIAVRKDKCKVFNQEERAYNSAGRYNFTSMDIDEYEKLLAEMPEGQILNKFKKYEHHTSSSDEYIPECCVLGGRIPPEMFIKH